MYRALSNNEYVIVSKTIYEERGLSGGLAESMFMAYTGRALALDEPEFDIFLESEKERKATPTEKQPGKVAELKFDSDLEPTEYLHKLESLTRVDPSSATPANCYVWFYGDEIGLDIRHKRLRVKFFNSLKYRKQVLNRYLDDGILVESQLTDTNLIGELLKCFHQLYPGTRQGIISSYETYFGDPSGFSYEMAVKRKAFHSDTQARRQFLKARNLPEGWGVNEIKEHLKEDALRSGLTTIEQIKLWDAAGHQS
jgi:hypothetical protein